MVALVEWFQNKNSQNTHLEDDQVQCGNPVSIPILQFGFDQFEVVTCFSRVVWQQALGKIHFIPPSIILKIIPGGFLNKGGYQLLHHFGIIVPMEEMPSRWAQILLAAGAC